MQTLTKILRKPLLSALISIFFGFLITSIILACSGYNPFETFGVLFSGIFSRPKYISNVIIKSTPLIIVGIGVSFAFKAGMFNIGAEGQYITGAMLATIVGCTFDFHPVLQIPLVLLAGIVGGGICGAIEGFLKAKFGINEVITCIMINWMAFYLSNFVVNSNEFHMPNTSATYRVSESSYTVILNNWKNSTEGIAALKQIPWLYDFFLKTDVNIGFIVSIILAVAVSLFLRKTTKGYEYRATGLGRKAAEFSGINVNSKTITSMLISGAICGLAAALVITGTAPHRISQLASFQNNGFNGMSVAFIANSSPVGCIIAGLFFGGLLYGGQSIQSILGIPTDVISIMIGIIVFFVAMTVVVPKIADKLERRGNK